MNIKRFTTGLIGFPIVAIVLVFGNKYLIDILFAIIALLGIHEYFNCFKGKANPVKWLGYVMAASIAFIHLIPVQNLIYIIAAILPAMLLILFLQSIITNLKTNIIDISVTLFGICYIVLFLAFMPLLMARDNGKLLIWYIMFAAWGTDTFAYLIGVKFGKHKFSAISPKKSIEGCIAGTLGAVLLILGYTYIINTYSGMNINYLIIAVIGLILSLIGQIGDFSASSVKRYVQIKDFSNLLPGHGGMLDRIDSVIFIAPFAYFLLMLI